jgi:hypothetical protein
VIGGAGSPCCFWQLFRCDPLPSRCIGAGHCCFSWRSSRVDPGANLLHGTMNAVIAIRAEGYDPNVIALSPEDAPAFALLRTSGPEAMYVKPSFVDIGLMLGHGVPPEGNDTRRERLTSPGHIAEPSLDSGLEPGVPSVGGGC